MTWDSIITSLGGNGALSEALSLDDSTISGWRKRGIPAVYWNSVVDMPVKPGCPEVTLEVLANLAARRRELAEARP